MSRFFSRFQALKRGLAGLAMGLGSFTSHAAWDSFIQGSFGPVVDWPLIPIHAALLPDGRLLSYGTDARGQQGAQFIYDVWSPAQGTDSASHLVLPNRTGVDSFCSGQVLLPGSGRLLLTGGDRTVAGLRNFANRDVNVFDFRTNEMSSAGQPMASQRWYPGVVTLASGDILVMGGSGDAGDPTSTPEVFSEGGGWRVLTGAKSDAAYGPQNAAYPRAWQAPNGKVFVLTPSGASYELDVGGSGALRRTALQVPQGDTYLPSVMFAPGKILSLRRDNQAVIIDLNGLTPRATRVKGVGQDRFHASATVMADGRVLVTGGSKVPNSAQGVAYVARIWNPATQAWTTAASAARMRLYHSVALLLPDGRVLTGGGGSPGPVTNLNAGIYTPPYLYRQDFSGKLATRPLILSAPAVASWGRQVALRTDAGHVQRVTLLKMGSATHGSDFEQRFMALPFTQSRDVLNVTLPASANVAPPGYYMLFIFQGGVPSVGHIIRLGD